MKDLRDLKESRQGAWVSRMACGQRVYSVLRVSNLPQVCGLSVYLATTPESWSGQIHSKAPLKAISAFETHCVSGQLTFGNLLQGSCVEGKYTFLYAARWRWCLR